MPGMIFINYRRSDTGWSARTVSERLAEEFTSQRLFIDVDLSGGVDFVEAVETQMAESEVMVSLIGPSWLSERDETGTRRIDNPGDWVRIELETALRRGIRVIPVLVDGAAMPSEGELPETLKLFARRQAIRITHENFAAQVQSLIKAVKLALSDAEEARSREKQLALLCAKAEAQRKREEATREAARLEDEAIRLKEEARRRREDATREAARLEDEALRLRKEAASSRDKARLIEAGTPLVGEEETQHAMEKEKFEATGQGTTRATFAASSYKNPTNSALIWLFTVVPISISLNFIFGEKRLSFITVRANAEVMNAEYNGVLAGLFLVLITETYMLSRRWRFLRPLEATIYWFGAALYCGFFVWASLIVLGDVSVGSGLAAGLIFMFLSGLAARLMWISSKGASG